MFAGIAGRYDVTNGVLSLGMHRRWRRALVRLAEAPKGGSVLDVATGTGDLAFRFRDVVGESGRVVGVDFCEPMLNVARAKNDEEGLDIDFETGDALSLPFADATFDVATIGFGVRNVDDPVRCIAEMARVVRPGGRVAVLEFGKPEGWMRRPYTWYSRWVVPLVGGAITGKPKAYRYLHESSSTFPNGDTFSDMMHDTGRFASVQAHELSNGIAYAYIGLVDSV